MKSRRILAAFGDSRIVGALSLGMTLALAASAAIAQQGSSAPVAISVVKPITFEIVSIRLHQPGAVAYGPGFTDDGLSVHGMTAFSLVYSYFGGQRTVGLPAWGSDSYDIQAKVADEDIPAWKKLNPQQRILTAQALLEDRFKLKWHRETRQMPGYALAVAKDGPKFKEATPDDPYKNGFKDLGGRPLVGVMFETGPGVTSAQAVSMAKLAEFLSAPWLAGRPVIDKTGLTGKYDFTFKYEPPRPASSPVSAAAGGEVVAADPTGPSFFTAIQEQLGLKLESGAMVPVEFLVVDHMERPSPN